jgi:hypothetical protein
MVIIQEYITNKWPNRSITFITPIKLWQPLEGDREGHQDPLAPHHRSHIEANFNSRSLVPKSNDPNRNAQDWAPSHRASSNNAHQNQLPRRSCQSHSQLAVTRFLEAIVFRVSEPPFSEGKDAFTMRMPHHINGHSSSNPWPKSANCPNREYN